ncbi:hypothetical protein D3Z45_15115 [Lachnospiraceae bacterium]|nr:hypothetical protein [Lachnospiraceae bacterium]
MTDEKFRFAKFTNRIMRKLITIIYTEDLVMLNIFKKKKRYFYTIEADEKIDSVVYGTLSNKMSTKQCSYTMGTNSHMALTSTLTEDEIVNELKKVFGKKCDVKNDGITISVKLKNRA